MVQKILITGASSGIGQALAEYYAREGVFLALTGRNEKRLQAVSKTCIQKSASVEFSCIDVQQPDKMKNWVGGLGLSQGFDLVIANAGISGGTGSDPQGEALQQAHEIHDINVKGVLNTVEVVLPAMLKNQSGQIALMSSLASFRGWPGAPAYSASKAFVRVYGEALRGSLKDQGIKVSVICPGFIQTPMTTVNPYPMPFMISAEKSAAIIAKGLKGNKGRIAFPWPMYIMAGFIGLLPDFIAQFLLRFSPSKPKN